MNINQYIIENTGFVLQIIIWVLFVTCLNYITKSRKKTKIGRLEIIQKDKNLMKMANSKLISLFIPKPESKSYKNNAQKLSKIGDTKYKNITIFYVKKAYYALLIAGISTIISLIPVFIFLIQKIAGIQNPFIILPPGWFIIISLLASVFIYFYPNIEIHLMLKKKETELKKEVISLGILVHTMMETGNNPYDILTMIKEIKPIYKNYIETTLNEYYVNTKRALENLKHQIGIWEFDMIIDSLIYAHETNNSFAANFLSEYISRLEQTFKISSEKTNKIKPYILLVGSMPPLIGALIVWFYPWLIQATENFSQSLGF